MTYDDDVITPLTRDR